MDTRQLAAFCAVVERQSFSQAAERLGVTQPAVSLQVRALEKRLGTQLLDRSGRRVEPTEAGLRLYRGAQRLLALEEQLLDEVARRGRGRARGRARDRRVDRPGGDRRAAAPLRVPARAPGRPRRAHRLRHADGRRAGRGPASSSSASSAPRGGTAASRFEPFFHDEVILACPPGHAFAGRTVTLDELREETLIVMQEGAGVRQMIEDELRRSGMRLRDLDVRLELGLQESVRERRAGRLRRHLHLARRRSRPTSRPGTLAAARVEGLELDARDLARARAPAARRRAPPTRSSSSRGSALAMIVRWGLGRAAGVAGRARASSGRCSSRASAGATSPCRHVGVVDARCRRDRIGGAAQRRSRADGILARRRRQRDRHRQGRVGADAACRSSRCRRRTPAPSGRRSSASATPTGGCGAAAPARALGGIVYEPELTLDLPRAETVGTALNALAHCAEALYVAERNAARRRSTRSRARR